MRRNLRAAAATFRRGFVVVLLALIATAPNLKADATFKPTTTASGSYSTAQLSAPGSLTATKGTCVPGVSRAVNLSWGATSSTFADGYDVKRSTTNGGPYTSITTTAIGTTTYTDSTVAASTTYYYVVEAKYVNWRSANSPQATITTPNAVTCL